LEESLPAAHLHLQRPLQPVQLALEVRGRFLLAEPAPQTIQGGLPERIGLLHDPVRGLPCIPNPHNTRILKILEVVHETGLRNFEYLLDLVQRGFSFSEEKPQDLEAGLVRKGFEEA